MRNIFSFLLICFCFSKMIFSQTIDYNPDSFSVEINNSELQVRNQEKIIIYQKRFSNPTGFYADLDNDASNEYLVIDSNQINNLPFFTLYIFNTIDSFYLADSIKSGSLQPYISNISNDENNSNEAGKTIIISGNSDFDEFNSANKNIFLPINCWLYDGTALFLINDEVYDLFLSENDSIINFIDQYYSSNNKNCASSEFVKPAIAAAYANYLNAGEKSIASQFLKNYYLCDDVEQFKNKLVSLMKNDLNGN